MLWAIKKMVGNRTRSADRRRVKPALEGLEERKLLYATLGDAWAIPLRITYSFVPDGTNVGGYSSNLNSTLNKLGTTAAWQLAFQKAAAYWSSYANINMAQVSDNGTDLGGAGAQQGDPNFGDIRIAMANQGANGVLASTFLPPTANGGSLAGDIVFNSGYAFKLNDDYDLQTVALHELGHSLGLDHSTDTNAAMTPYYEGVRQAPTPDDSAGIQSVYGAYPSDSDTNRTINTPTNITRLMTSNGQISIGALNLAGPSDLDWYSVTAPANTTGTMTVTMQAASLSMVSPRVAVYNSAKTGLAQFYSPTLGGNATVNITGVTAGQVYYIRASAASSPGAYGAFGLLVNFGSASQAPIAPPNTTIAAVADRGGGSSSQTTSSGILSVDVAAMTTAITLYPLMPAASITILTADTAELQGLLADNGDTSSKAYMHLDQLAKDLGGQDMSRVSNDFNNFLSDLVRIGTLTGYGDTMRVSPASQTHHHSTTTPNSSNASPGIVIGVPPAIGATHKHATAHPRATTSHFPVTGARSNWSGQHLSTAFKLKSGHA